MNQLGIDILSLLSKHGITGNQDDMLRKVADNIDRVKLCNDIDKCNQCSLFKSTSHKVFGEGPRNAPLMIIGSYSGKVENVIGRPFAGPASDLLDKLLFDACIDRSKIYITNPVRCHTPYDRTPSVDEISCCAGQFLARELKIIKPKHIITMGGIAASLFSTEPLSAIRGQTIETRGYSVTFSNHPNTILSNKGSDYTDMYNFAVEDLSRSVTDLIENFNDMSICRDLTQEEEEMLGLKGDDTN